MNLLHNDYTDVFFVLDFDRCLGQTEKLQALLEEAITKEGVVDLDMIQYAHRQVKKTGGSFDTAAYVRQVLKDRQLDVNHIWGKIEADFIAAAEDTDVFEPHARELLRILTEKNLPFGIVTFGGFDWQTAKLRAAGLTHVPYVITSYKEKGRMIASWQRPDRMFAIPEELSGGVEFIARRVVLVDDKPVSFEGIPNEVVGVCVSPMAPSGKLTYLPSNVIVVQGIEGVIRALFASGD